MFNRLFRPIKTLASTKQVITTNSNFNNALLKPLSPISHFFVRNRIDLDSRKQINFLLTASDEDSTCAIGKNLGGLSDDQISNIYKKMNAYEQERIDNWLNDLENMEGFWGYRAWRIKEKIVEGERCSLKL